MSPDFYSLRRVIFPTRHRENGHFQGIRFKMAIFPVSRGAFGPQGFLQKLLTKKCFGAINFVKIAKEPLYKADSLACLLTKRDMPMAATLERKSPGGIIFVMITKIITKEMFQGNIL